MSQPTSNDRPPGLANAQVTGGGGHEPDLDQSGPDDTRARVPAAGSGVDMKSDSLDQPADD
jgi:hypothetical protein